MNTTEKNKKSGFQWPLAVVGMLAVSLSVCGLTVYFSLSDPAFTIEADYYEQAVGWDDTARERDASAALGWSSEVTIGLDGEAAVLRVVLHDGDGGAIDGASVVVSAFQYARVGEEFDGELVNAGDGVYVAEFAGAAKGQWQVRLRATLGDDVYVLREDVKTTGVSG